MGSRKLRFSHAMTLVAGTLGTRLSGHRNIKQRGEVGSWEVVHFRSFIPDAGEGHFCRLFRALGAAPLSHTFAALSQNPKNFLRGCMSGKGVDIHAYDWAPLDGARAAGLRVDSDDLVASYARDVCVCV